MVYTIIGLALIAGTTDVRPVHAVPAGDELATEISNRLICFPIDLMGIRNQNVYTISREICLSAIYQAEGLHPIWVTPEGPGPKAHTLVRFLENIENEGLDPQNYEVDQIMELFSNHEPKILAGLDILLTLNLIKYVEDASFGRIKPHTADPLPADDAGDIPFAPVEIMAQAIKTHDFAAYMESLPPQHQHYKSLKKVLMQYRDMEKNGGWSPVSDGKTLRPGDGDDRIPAIMHRLSVTGDLDENLSATRYYDPLLKGSVMKFQKRHGLPTDGVIGPKTLSAMNIPVSARIKQILINMTRWRWQKHSLGEKYVLVNIANFDLAAFANGQEDFRIPVVVGKSKFQTPVFSDRIIDITLNPYWNIPPSIAQNEELPKLRKDADYLLKQRIRLFSGWTENAREVDSRFVDWNHISPGAMRQFKLRQDPGPWNALGQIKFNSPNGYDVYLHDTPSQHLFSRSQRDFSHGCIRVSDPFKLAVFALAGQSDDWPIEKIHDTIKENKHVVIRLADPLPVHITYQTAWVDKNGLMCFNNDIYGHDARLRKAFFNE